MQERGLEPPLLIRELDPKSSASTNSATLAVIEVFYGDRLKRIGPAYAYPGLPARQASADSPPAFASINVKNILSQSLKESTCQP